MLNSRSSTYRAIVNSLVLMILILIPIATSTTTNGTFKIVDLSTVSTPDKSIYYDLNSRQSFEIVTGDASRLPTGPIFESRNGTCECQGFVCGCCAGIRVDLFNFDRKTCANLTFKGEDLSIQVNLLVDDVSYFHTKVSGTNPPPLCVPLYFFPIINFCGRIFNLGVQNNNLHACVDFETKISQWPIFILHFRCIKIGLNGIDWSDRTTESAIFKPLIDLTLPFSSNQTSGISFFSSEVYDDVAFEPENIENPATTVAMSDEEALMIGTLKN